MTDPRFEGKPLPDPGFADDDGSLDPRVGAELERFAAGSGDPAGLLRAVATSRLLVPVVAVLEESEVDDDGRRRDKTSSMASVTVQAPDGSLLLLAFTSTDSLAAWRPDARPIAAATSRVAQAALYEGAQTLVVDPSGPVPFAFTGDELRALAWAADPSVPSHADPSVRAAVAAIVTDEPAVDLASVTAGDPAGIRVVLVVDDTIALEQFRALVARLESALAGDPLLRARSGSLQVAIVPPHRVSEVDPESVAFRRA